MRCAKSLAIVAAAGSGRADLHAGYGEKRGLGRDSGAPSSGPRARDRASGDAGARRRSSHSGTTSRASTANDPGLSSAFAAQVIGRMLPSQPSEARSALQAYERNHICGKGGWLFDSEV